MIEWFKKVVNDTFTGIDNKTYHSAKFSWFFSNMTIGAVAVHQAWRGQIVDLMSFAGALATVATAHGAVIWGTKTTEPQKENNV